MTHIFPFCSVWYLLLKREVLLHRCLRCRASPPGQWTGSYPQCGGRGRDAKLWTAKKHGCQPSWEEACLVLVDGDLSEEDADQTEEVGRRHKEAKYGAWDVSLSLFGRGYMCHLKRIVEMRKANVSKIGYAWNIENIECLTGRFWGGSLGWGVPFRTPRDNRPAWSGDTEQNYWSRHCAQVWSLVWGSAQEG